MARLKSGLTEVAIQMSKAKSEALLEASAAVVSLAKQFCPVDTGRLRQSIGATPMSSKRVRIGTNLYYAPFVEYGTVNQAAQPFLTPALAQFRPTFEAIMTRKAREAAGHALRSTKRASLNSIANLGTVRDSRPYIQAASLGSANDPFDIDPSLFND
jgi:HK97 gp10 family phage protein